jgi:predicted ATPase
MTAAPERLTVITGGPGSGKTTLIDLLRERGFAVAPEAGRAIIQDQTTIGGTALPWRDPALFAELMLAWELRSYRWALDQPGPVFFDHAVPSVASYLRLTGLPVPDHVTAAVAAFPYHPRVFVAPPWPEIYRTDEERHQDLAEARRTYDVVVETYTGFGYRLVELPRVDVAERLRFVLRHRDGAGPMVDEPEPDCWLHPDVAVEASPIAGRGLFARAPIPAGTAVSRLGGRLVTEAELQELFAAPDHPYVDTIMVTGTLHLVLPPRRPNGYGNHGCDPNLWWSDAYTLAARRDIAAGEELTNDYATSTGSADFTMACSCGSALCRGTVTGADWRRPELRERYGDHWVPGLLDRIRAAGLTPRSC